MDEKFFESLASGHREERDEPEIELARANLMEESRRKETASHSRTAHEAGEMKEREASSGSEPEGQLTVDVYETPENIVVESAIAGVRAEDVDVTATPDSLTIRGSRERENHEEGKDYIYQECYWGRFSRSIILPQEVDPDGASVTLRNGILTVRLPKANKRRTKKLQVRAE